MVKINQRYRRCYSQLIHDTELRGRSFPRYIIFMQKLPSSIFETNCFNSNYQREWTFERSFFDSLIFDEPQWYRLEIKLQRVEILSLVARSCDKRSKRFATLSDWKSVSHSSVIDACKVVRCKGWIIRLVNIIKIEWSTATNLGTFLLSLNTRDRFSHVLFDNQRSLVVDLYF